jgi:ligand-binding SRPBCC domain-containing protein
MPTATHCLERSELIQRPLDEVFAFFASAENLEALTPPFLRFQVLTPLPIEMRVGTRIDYALSLFGVPLRWRTRITVWEPGRRFVDEQESGPYRLWRHTHEFEAKGTSTRVRDHVEYQLPFGPLGVLTHSLWVERTLNRIFDFRRDAMLALLSPAATHAA